MTVEDLGNYPRKGNESGGIFLSTQSKISLICYYYYLSGHNTARKLSAYLQNPGPTHVEAVNRAIAYLCNTRFLAIRYSGQYLDRSFIYASDATYADDPID